MERRDTPRPTMSHEEMINDYPRLKLEYTRLHEEYRKLEQEREKLMEPVQHAVTTFRILEDQINKEKSLGRHLWKGMDKVLQKDIAQLSQILTKD